MEMNRQEYSDYVEQRMPRSRAGRNMLRAFLTGGLICTHGQGPLALYTRLGLEPEAAGTAGSVTLIFLGALLTAAGVYDKIAKFGGAGTLVPITGFANAVAAPALEYKTEGRIAGTAAKMFVIAGPVIVFGIGSSVDHCIHGENEALRSCIFFSLFSTSFSGWPVSASPVKMRRYTRNASPSGIPGICP